MEKMTQNILHSAWSEKIAAHIADEEFDDSARKNSPTSRRSFNNPENDIFFNPAHMNDNGLVPNVNLTEDTTFHRRNRGNRYMATDEIEYETPSLVLKQTHSSDTIYSKGSRNLSRHSPPGSFRGFRSSNAAPLRRESSNDGINIIMLFGFAIGIAFGTIFNFTEVYLKWFQLKIAEMQVQFFGGRTIQEFYLQEDSIPKKVLYSPMSALFFILQSLLYIVLIGLDFLKKPAPKALVSNVMMRYVNE